jgi:hypothetical protein
MKAITLAVAAAVLAATFAVSARAGELTVRATFDKPTIQFGEATRAHIVVLVDPSLIRPGSIHIVSDPGPLTELTPPQTARAVVGGTVVISSERTLSCLSSACVAARGDVTPRLPAVTVTATTRGGSTVRTRIAWPVLHVRGRVSAADLARSRPPFRSDTSVPPVSYRIAPATLSDILVGVAAALGLAALALAAREGLRLARRGRAAPAEEALSRALRLAREAEARPAPDRRRALGLLARLLKTRDGRLASDASGLAWSRPAPEPDALAAIVGDVEREVQP